MVYFFSLKISQNHFRADVRNAIVDLERSREEGSRDFYRGGRAKF